MLIVLMLFFLPIRVFGIYSDIDERVYRIGKIIIHRNEVFDTTDSAKSNWIFDIANQTHVLTKESVIRSRLLFKEGDVYDQTIVDESCRILRSMGMIGDIAIRCDTIAANIVEINIVTNDKWTLGMNASYKQDGGITFYSATIKDDNLLGNAQNVSIGYNYSSDRRSRHGTEVIIKEPHLFRKWWKLILQYKSNENLNTKTLLIERPFYCDAATWSVGSYLDAEKSRVHIFKDGIITQEYDIHQENKLIWGSLAICSSPKIALGIAYIHTRTKSVATDLPLSDNIDLTNLSFSVMDRSYYTTSRVENFGRIEDIPLGFQGNITLGKNFQHSTAASAQYFCRVNWQQALQPATKWYVGYYTNLSGFIVKHKFRDATLMLSCLQHLKLFEKHLLALRTSLVIGENWSNGVQLTLGSQSGLRGYPAYALSGNRQILLNFEHRFFSGIELWIFRFGTAIFIDSGSMWNDGDRFGQQRFHSAAGFGLRIENTKQAGSGIIRIDFALNLDKNRIAQVIFSSDHLFRAFQNIDYIPPTEIH